MERHPARRNGPLAVPAGSAPNTPPRWNPFGPELAGAASSPGHHFSWQAAGISVIRFSVPSVVRYSDFSLAAVGLVR
jgi:hypothetical protein